MLITNRGQEHPERKGQQKSLTKDHLWVPIHQETICSRRNWQGRCSLRLRKNTSRLQPSIANDTYQNACRKIETIMDGDYDTFSDWHTQPRFPSCGQNKPNVFVLASTILSLVGSSISAGFELCRWISIIIAHPQFCESVKCSVIGLSSSSHPSMALSHRKHLVLSGFVSWGS